MPEAHARSNPTGCANVPPEYSLLVRSLPSAPRIVPGGRWSGSLELDLGTRRNDRAPPATSPVSDADVRQTDWGQ
eukprot:2043291-Pyramimonas_sp.AAC.1